MGDPAFEAEIRALLAQNQKIMAVKLYRERTGVGLAEAKAVVDAVQAGGTVRHVTSPAPGAAPTPSPPSAGEPIEATVARLVREDRKLDAIKWVRERTGMGLAEAKQWVDAIQANRALNAPAPPAVPAPGSADAELIEIARRSGKIEAIKQHRTRFGSGLAEAKDYVEALLERASRGVVVTAPAAATYAAMPVNPPPPSVRAPSTASVVTAPTFGASSAEARSALKEAPLPETMSSWAVNPPPVASTYVPRERKGFGRSETDADRIANQGHGAALGTFVLTAIIALLALAGGVAFLAMR